MYAQVYSYLIAVGVGPDRALLPSSSFFSMVKFRLQLRLLWERVNIH